MRDPPGMRNVNKRLQRSAGVRSCRSFLAPADEKKPFFKKKTAMQPPVDRLTARSWLQNAKKYAIVAVERVRPLGISNEVIL